MAIVMVFESPEVTAEIYDAVLNDMVQKFGAPKGRIFHVAGPTDSGWRVVDVWENQEEFDKFAREQIGPFLAKHGVKSQPSIDIWPVHNQIP
jgi:hypothetical protein